jgi:DNA-directed RNA polymerase specialized sigma24 family protein
VEAFCGDVIVRFMRGERATHLPGTDAHFSPADKEDALAFLLAASWEAWQHFRPVDDGRGTNRFSGYLVWILHRRLVDWIRQTKGSTRYPTSRFVATLVPLTPAIEERMAPFLDPEPDDGDYGLDLDAAPAGTREALELIRPLIDGEMKTVKEVAQAAEVELTEVESALALVQVAARRQGLEPASEERHALADQVRVLREQRMSYPQIAAMLGLPSSSTVNVLVRHYYPELIHPHRARRRTLSANEHRESPCDAIV